MGRGEEIEATEYEGLTSGGNNTEGKKGVNHHRLILSGIPD